MTEHNDKLDLVIQSNTDFFLTGNPEISFFNCVYRRYTHFSSQLFDVKFNTPIDFGAITEVKLPIMGDLLHKMYLKFTIPKISIPKSINKELSQEYLNELNSLNTLNKVFKSMMNRSMISYIEIIKLQSLNTLTIENLYQILSTNTAIFESETITTDTGTMLSYIYLSKQLKDEKFNNVIPSSSYTYTYGNYLSSLTMSKENIKSYLSKFNYKENITNIIKILNNIKKSIEQLNKKINYLINEAQNNYNESINNKFKFAWIKHLGNALIDYIELRIGNDTIDKQYGQWIDIWHELNGDKKKDNLYLDMIGDKEELTTFDNNEKPQTTLYVPIPFYFCRFIGLSLPLIALQYSDIIIRLKLRDFKDVCYSDCTTMNLEDITRDALQCSLLCETYYLSKNEREKFARASHEYLIEQTQYNIESFILNDINTHQFNFAHPVKGIVWLLQKNKHLQLLENITKYGNNDPFNNLNDYNVLTYEDNITNNTLTLSNDTLESNGENYFDLVQPYNRFDNSGINGLYTYWYSIYPYEQQPSGSCNMSFIKNNKLLFTVNSKIISSTYDLICYALNYNILRISNGSGKLVFK